MSTRLDKMKSGYTELTPQEKFDLKEFIRQFDNSSEWMQRNLTENLRTVVNKSVGPKDSNTCVCCGK